MLLLRKMLIFVPISKSTLWRRVVAGMFPARYWIVSVNVKGTEAVDLIV